jgi:hypothetical protein
MKRQPLLPFINDEDFIRNVEAVLSAAQSAFDHAEDKLYSNTIDPFSAVFDASRQGISLEIWLQQEKSRQVQKTMQNAIGAFHQNLIGSIPGWESLHNKVIDVINKEKLIIAEIKNKYSTTKGNHMKNIYDDILSALKSDYKGFTGYYVEIIPHTLEPYDKPFTPSDNIKKNRRRTNEKIRKIDGKSFYALATGRPGALKELYYALPKAIASLKGTPHDHISNDSLFEELFARAYV